jgi:hypothetical protein
MYIYTRGICRKVNGQIVDIYGKDIFIYEWRSSMQLCGYEYKFYTLAGVSMFTFCMYLRVYTSC